MIGTTLGPYKILDKIGSGGFAQVYLARDMRTNEVVALKVLRTEYTENAEFISRFQREAEALQKLPRTPHIVALHEFGEQDGIWYIAMEYLEGHDLEDVIHRVGALPVETALSITAQIAEALDMALKGGVLHRDVKPANTKINPQGVAKIMDFGIARAAEGTKLTHTGIFVGTPSYLAPEIWEGQPASPQSDVYALGVMLCEMLLGKSPFEATTPAASMRKHLLELPPRLTSLRPDVPAWLDHAIERALAKDMTQRYPDAGQFLAELRSHGPLPAVVNVKTLMKTQLPQTAPAASSGSSSPAPVDTKRWPPSTQTPETQRPTKRRSDISLKLIGILAGVIGLVLVALIGLAVLGNPGKGDFVPAIAGHSSDTPTPASPTATQTPTLTATPPPTATPTPSATPSPPASNTPLPSRTPTTRASSTPSPGSTPTNRATAVTSPTPMSTATPGPTRVIPTTQPGVLFDFESAVNWQRGDQPNGTFTQSTQQPHSGQASARLDYSFPSGSNDFVVFLNRVALSGQPNTIGAWGYGDGSGHFINAWIRDSGGQVWQVPLGRVGGTGWRQMVGYIATGQEWPWQSVSGTDNGQVDYPIQFYALVLDDGADTFTGSGTIYVDDITVWRSEHMPTPAVTQPSQTGTPSALPTSAPLPPGSVGRVVFTSLIDKSYYLYHADPSTSNAIEIGRTDSSHSTCSNRTASTLTGQSISLYRGNRCTLSSGFTTCKSPNGQFELVIGIQANDESSISIRPAGGQGDGEFLYSGKLKPQEPVAWSLDGSRFTFVAKDGTIFMGTATPPKYAGLTNGSDVMWSPDGTLLLFSRWVSGQARDLFVINPDGSGEHNITNSTLIDKLCPAWRP